MSTAVWLSDRSLALTGGFQSYLNHVTSLPILTEAEERELFVRYHQENDLEAVRKIILSHLRFVAYIAKNYSGYGLPLEDLVQEGSIGLMKAVKRFDLARGVRLASFAVHWIKAEIHGYVLRNWKLVQVATTKAQRKLFFNLRKMKKKLGWMSADEAREVAEYLGVRVADVQEMELRLQHHDIYFDQSFGEANTADYEPNLAPSQYLEDHSCCPERIIDLDFKCRSMAEIRRFLNTLDDRANDIIASRWLVDGEHKASLKDLAIRYGISQERVRQIESETLQRLCKHLQSCGIEQNELVA